MGEARVLAAALLLTGAAVVEAVVVTTEKPWLYALVLAAVGLADLPLVARVRRARGAVVALLLHVGALVAGWFVAFAVWAPFVHWG